MIGDLTIFEDEQFGRIRSVIIDGEPWFVGKDVASALGFKDTVNALKAHIEEEDKMGWRITTSSRGEQQVTIINESGLYSLIFGSKLDSAKEFKHWVTSIVLPTIRKTGKFSLDKKSKQALRDKSKKIRNCFTDTLQNHGYEKFYEYVNTTNAMKKRLGIKAKKDDMTKKELAAVSAAEWLSIAMIADEYGYANVNPVCIDASESVAKTIEEKKKKLLTA